MPRTLDRIVSDLRGSIALNAALGLPVALIAAGAAIDYTNLNSQRTTIQILADTTAVASAKELRTGNGNSQTINAIAGNVALAAMAGSPLADSTTIKAAAIDNGNAVTVTIRRIVPSLVGKLIAPELVTVTATATARLAGSPAVCLLALNKTAIKSLEAQQTALLTGAGCGLYSDSTAANSIIAKGQARITAKLICSAGGAVGNTSGLTPAPTTDCPPIGDPLASRPMPSYGGCTETNLVLSGGTQTLNPGVYCGGLRITDGAKVIANPGVFVIKDGPLTVDGNSSLTANEAGFFLTGTGARLHFAAGANMINLKAPITGPLAGLLVFEDRNNAGGVRHEVQSDDARNLLGTIYLPRGVLSIGSNARVADQSAYTVIIADSVVLTGGPNMVLNANYASTNVPVPDGVGPRPVTLQQ
ncbi:MAG: pilus assembly protein [Hyphomicrobiales bacterium]|nr:pilus assembly protein [Hyphomicrobiales bacterium]